MDNSLAHVPTDMLKIMRPQEIAISDISYLCLDVLESYNNHLRVKLLPAAQWASYPRNHVRQFCAMFSRYLIPTVELVEWVKEKIGGRKAIELAAGMGDFGLRLGIPMTDSYMQQKPEIAAIYSHLRQPVTSPPPDVERYEAIEAIMRFKPEVAVAAFLTQKYQQGDTPKAIGSSVHGPDESRILQRVRSYIFVGNEVTHKGKRILQKPHETFKFPWIVTRCEFPEANVIWVWNQ